MSFYQIFAKEKLTAYSSKDLSLKFHAVKVEHRLLYIFLTYMRYI